MKIFAISINGFVPLVVSFYFGCSYHAGCEIESFNPTQAGATNSNETSLTSSIAVRPNATVAAVASFASPADKGSVKATLLIRQVDSFRCFVGVMGRTNLVAYKPLPTQAYEARLFDVDGRPIPKTREGRKRFGRSLAVDDELRDPAHHRILNWLRDERTFDLSSGDAEFGIWDFRVLESFRVKRAGTYRLQVHVRLFVKDNNDGFLPLLLEPVETQLTIREKDLPPQQLWPAIIFWSSAAALCGGAMLWLAGRRASRNGKEATH